MPFCITAKENSTEARELQLGSSIPHSALITAKLPSRNHMANAQKTEQFLFANKNHSGLTKNRKFSKTRLLSNMVVCRLFKQSPRAKEFKIMSIGESQVTFLLR